MMQSNPISDPIRGLLATSDVFSGLEERELDALLAVSRIQRSNAGDLLFREGDAAGCVLFILSGRVKVEIEAGDGVQIAVRTMGVGELFGEMAALNAATRSATVTVTESAEFLVVSPDEFLELLGRNPRLGIRVQAIMSDRLRHETEGTGPFRPEDLC